MLQIFTLSRYRNMTEIKEYKKNDGGKERQEDNRIPVVYAADVG